MPRRKKKPEKVELTPAQKKIRRAERARNRKPRVKLTVDFDWSTVPCRTHTDRRDFTYCCSVKCLRANENPPLSPTGNACWNVFLDEKGKLRWMAAFIRRSERDEMLRESKELNGRKARKEPRREQPA